MPAPMSSASRSRGPISRTGRVPRSKPYPRVRDEGHIVGKATVVEIARHEGRPRRDRGLLV